MKINTDIIEKDYSINSKAILSDYISSTVFTSEDAPLINSTSSFSTTILINNKSNTFIKNSTLRAATKDNNQTSIDILNVNQSKLNGYDISIKGSLNNTFIVNTNNSQSTIKCDQLSSNNIFNARNEDQSFFNFPSPTDTKNFVLQPMMISNGQRTIWSENKYGHINQNNFESFADFQTHIPHDLNGQDIFVKNSTTEILANLSNYHNGSLTIVGDQTDDNETNIENCTVKLVLSGFDFKHLNIKNCTNVYLQDCSFSNSDHLYGMREVQGDETDPWKFKKSDFSNVTNYCLKTDNSKVFIKNANRNMIFDNFYLGIYANNNSQIFMIPENEYVGILLRQNLSNYDERTGSRPIFMLASNGSTINCDYYKMKDGYYVNTFSAYIQYPSHLSLGYKGNDSETFEITDKQYFDEYDRNYRRVKSLLFSLWSQINNGKVNFSLNKNAEIEQPAEISIPPFGLYQMAKPKLNVPNSPWKLANTYYHILSGTESKHISASGNDEWYLNTYDANGNMEKDAGYFFNYNCSKSNIDNSFINTFPYSESQPHLAHYFNNSQPVTYIVKTADRIFKPNMYTKTLLRQNTSNITNMKNNQTSFEAYIGEKKVKVYFNPLKNTFYYYNINKELIDVTEQISRFMTYKTNNGESYTNRINKFFTTSISGSNTIHNIYYDTKLSTYYYINDGNVITDINNQIASHLSSRSSFVNFVSEITGVVSGTLNTDGTYFISQRSLDEVPALVSSLIPTTDGRSLKLKSLNKAGTRYIQADHYNSETSTFINYLNINNIKENIFTFTKTITEKIKKKKKVSTFVMDYDPTVGKFFYQEEQNNVYTYDASIKKDLRYIFNQTIDITAAKTENKAIEINDNGTINFITYNTTTNKFRLINGSIATEIPYSKIRVIFDAANPQNSRYFFLIKNLDITNQVKNSKSHITTYENNSNKNVDVYYNDEKGFFYWENDKTQRNITIETFTCTLDGNENEYFTNGLLDISDVVNGNANSFITYIDGQNRLVFYNFQQQEFYYWDDNDKEQKIDVSNKIIIDKKYTYNNTKQIPIMDVMANTRVGFYSDVISGGNWIFYNTTDGFYISGHPETATQVNKIVIGAIISSYDEETEALTGVYYYQTTPKDITHIVINSFNAVVDDKEETVYYNSDDNTFFIKDEFGNIIDVTDSIRPRIRLLYNQTDISELFLQPNYASTTIEIGGTPTQVYYDNSNNIFYTPSSIPLTINTRTEDGMVLYNINEQEDLDITDVVNNYFEAWDYEGANTTNYNVYYDVPTHKFVDKNNVDVTNNISGNLDWYFKGDKINEVITGTAQLIGVQIEGQARNVSYDSQTGRFVYRTTPDLVDVSYYINQDLECYYKNEDITDIIKGDKFFTIELSGKNRDVYCNSRTGQFYLNKSDVTENIFNNVHYQYIVDVENNVTRDVTNIILNHSDHFDGIFVNDEGTYISSTIYYDQNNDWYFVNDDNQQEYITVAVNSNISENFVYQNKIKIEDVIKGGNYFDGVVSTVTSSAIINGTETSIKWNLEYVTNEHIYWDNAANSAYFIDKNNYQNYNANLVNNIKYYYNNTDITNIINSPGTASISIGIEDNTNTVNVFYDKMTNGFYFMEGVESTYITDIILDGFKVQLSNLTIPTDLTIARFGGNGVADAQPFEDKYVYWDSTQKKFYYKTSDVMGMACEASFETYINYFFGNTNINDTITGTGSFNAVIQGSTREIKYDATASDINNTFYYEYSETVVIDETDPDNPQTEIQTGIRQCFNTISSSLKCQYLKQNTVSNITDVFLNQNRFFTLSVGDIYYKNLNDEGYCYCFYNNRHYLHNIFNDTFLHNAQNINIDPINYFYFSELELSDILNGNPFTTDVIRDVYYYDPTQQFVYNSLNGQKIDVTEQLTPYTYNKYYHKNGKNYDDITDVIYNGASLTTTYEKVQRACYFNSIRCNNMTLPFSGRTGDDHIQDFGRCFYYIDNFEEYYIKNNTIGSGCTMSSYYYGNLFDMSDKINRQSASIFLLPASSVQNIFYDTYGGRTKNTGVYYSYKANGDMVNRTSQMSGMVTRQYMYNKKNITDTVDGAHFYFSRKGKDYQSFFDKTIGKFYYLSGDTQKWLSGITSDAVSGKFLAYKYSGKIDLAGLQKSKNTSFYTFIDKSNIPSLASFSIKNNQVTITSNKANVTNLLQPNIKYDSVKQRYYLYNVDLKHVVWNSQNWFWTPIDGVSRRVYFQKYNKTLGKYRFYYTPNFNTKGDKIDVTNKITSKLNYYFNNKDINKVMKGTYFETKFENAMVDATPQKVYYDRRKKIYYYFKREYLETDYVKNNIYVDITPVFKYKTKWAFLATVGGEIRQIYYDTKNFYYYLDGKNKIRIERTQIENSTNYFNKNGDGKEYYHDTNITDYLIEDSYLLVMVNGKITEVWYDEQYQRYYYEKDKVNVTEIIQASVQTKYFWNGQIITDLIYPDPTKVQNLDQFKDYKYYFYWNWFGGTTNDEKYYYRSIFYNPNVGFYAKNPGWSIGHAYNFDPDANKQNNRIVHDQILPYLHYFFYDQESDVQINIDDIVNDPTESISLNVDGVQREVYYKIPSNAVYTYRRKNPALGTQDYDNHKLHEAIYYYKEGSREVDITQQIIPNLVIKFYWKDITKVVEDGLNYTLLAVKGMKRSVYYNPSKKSWYYYKDNKFTRVDVSNVMATNLLYEDEKPKYYCYSTNIDLVLKDKNDKYRFLATTQEDIFYDFGAGEFYYFSDEQQTQKEFITKQITPNLQKEYWVSIGDEQISLTDVVKGIRTQFQITIDGQVRTVTYNSDNDKYFYTVIEDENLSEGKFLNNIHNSVEMVVSNINDHKNLTNVLKITNSKLYQDIYKF